MLPCSLMFWLGEAPWLAFWCQAVGDCGWRCWWELVSFWVMPANSVVRFRGPGLGVSGPGRFQSR